MHLKAFRKWIRRVYATREEELDCEGLFNAIPAYVDWEIAGQDAEVHFPGVKHHLNQCAECYDLYLTLRDVAQLEHCQSVSETPGAPAMPENTEPAELECL